MTLLAGPIIYKLKPENHHVEGFEVGELLSVLVDEVGQLPKHLATLRARGLGPDIGERLLGDLDGVVDILLEGLLDLADDLAGRRVDGRERLARLGLDELVSDEEAGLDGGLLASNDDLDFGGGHFGGSVAGRGAEAESVPARRIAARPRALQFEALWSNGKVPCGGEGRAARARVMARVSHHDGGNRNRGAPRSITREFPPASCLHVVEMQCARRGRARTALTLEQRVW